MATFSISDCSRMHHWCAGIENPMKHTLAVLLSAFIVFHAPWRLMALTAETFVLRPGNAHVRVTSDYYWDVEALENRLIGLGWTVQYARDIRLNGVPAYGITDHHSHAIVVESALQWDARYAVLAHEAGHTLQPFWADGIQADCFAEAVAVLLVHDGLREHARYLASQRWVCTTLMLAEWPAIYHAAALLQD
jgi:hypothetical protein